MKLMRKVTFFLYFLLLFEVFSTLSNLLIIIFTFVLIQLLFHTFFLLLCFVLLSYFLIIFRNIYPWCLFKENLVLESLDVLISIAMLLMMMLWLDMNY